MSRQDELMTRLDRARELLLAPHPRAMEECRLTLECAVAIASGEPRPYGDRVRRAIQNIRFLLERAAAFWNARTPQSAPVLQYSSRGSLVTSPEPPMFAIEV
jgi:hypothetical protein